MRVALPRILDAMHPQTADLAPTTGPHAYWGKARPEASAGGSPCHLLLFHCLDVAAAGVAILRRYPAFARWFTQRLGLAHDTLEPWIAFWLALHDLGKFSEAFQSQCPDVFHALRQRPPDPAKPYTLRHDSLGMLVWTQVLRERVLREAWFGAASLDLCDGLDHWARACTGHHGQPPTEGGYWGQHFDRHTDGAAIAAFVDEARALFLDDVAQSIAALDPVAFHDASQQLSWWIAGLAVLADWLGSNTRFFPYRDQPLPLAAYWQRAQQQATRALDASGIVAAPRSEALSFKELFPQIEQASPLQDWAAHVPLNPGPQIHLLEDVTGAGKTEAALMLTHRLLSGGHADGFYVALPTMATANAMYGRVAATYRSLFADAASLILATSQRTLVEEFAATVLPPDIDEHDSRQIDDTASARCSAWLADHNKRALLSPAGVGTIDQALLAVLYSKHQSLRLLGLVHKLLVVDEVHACDAYMQALLERLLEFHAHAGGSAILLSATLPAQMKQRLLAAFARGAGASAVPRPHADAYPLACSWDSAGGGDLREQPLATPSRVRRTVQVRFAQDASIVVQTIERALQAGRCVCWIRNTVADALDACELFRSRVPADKLLLFHARFALHDRLQIEQTVLAAFGKASTSATRAGRLLIATQVVEQSLDVDFDLLVSDLAPVDRIIQRAGRLARHRRTADGTPQADADAPDARGEPVLWLLAPPWSDAPEAGWFKSTFPKAATVYPHHGQLWLTARALRSGAFTMPDDARRLIESVFGTDAELPAGLQANALKAEGDSYAAITQGQMNALALGSGYRRGGIDWWSEAKTPSRLGEATTMVTLARWAGGVLRPWAHGPVGTHGWAYSSLRVASRLIDAEAAQPDTALRAALDAARAHLPAQGRWTVLLPLAEHDGKWTGEALGAARNGQAPRRLRWVYDAQQGLSQDKDSDPALDHDSEP